MKKVIWLLFIFYAFNSLVAFSQPAEKNELDYNNPKEVNNMAPQDIASGIQQGKIDPKIVDDQKLASALKENNQIAANLDNNDLARALRQDTSLIDSAKNPQIFAEVNSRTKEKPEFLNLNPELKKAWFANYKIEDKGGSIASFDGESKIKTLGPKSNTFDVEFIAKNYPGSIVDISGALKLPNGDEVSNAEITAVADGKIKIDGAIGQLKTKDAIFFPSEELFYDGSGEVSGKGIYTEHKNGLKLEYTGFLIPIEDGFRGNPISYLSIHADNGLKIPLGAYKETIDMVSNEKYCSKPITCAAVNSKTGQIDIIRDSEIYIDVSFTSHEEPPAGAQNYAGIVGASPRLSFTARDGSTTSIEGKEIRFGPATNPSHVGDLHYILNAPVQKDYFNDELPPIAPITQRPPQIVRSILDFVDLIAKLKPSFIEDINLDPNNPKVFFDRISEGKLPYFKFEITFGKKQPLVKQ